ncbi:MAG: hypothetical protein HOW73_49825 [Polyangiaceae bacterium]|nr:hypothetical protein [Polyangiaceae bacterium]
MLHLTLIGYWRSASEQHWPEPGAFVDPTWNAGIRERIIAHLTSGAVLRVAGGASWCRFRCAEFGAYGLGSAELTDGEYVWPSGLAHYVAQHQVRLPDKFVAAITRRHGQAPIGQSFDADDFEIDFEWWRNQGGFGGRAAAFTTPAPRGRLFALTAGVAPTAPILRALRACPEVHSRSLPDMRDAILRGEEVLLTAGVLEAEVVGLRRDLEGLGVRTRFEPKDGAV